MAASVPKKQVRVMVFGTFDVIHPGHLHFFKQARGLARRGAASGGGGSKLDGAAYLIVSVARDANVKRIKGQAPLYTERARLAAVKKIKLVDRAVLGGVRTYLPHIARERPDIIALGHDQANYTKNLRADLAKRGVVVKVVRLKAHRRHAYRSSLYKQRIKHGSTRNRKSI